MIYLKNIIQYSRRIEQGSREVINETVGSRGNQRDDDDGTQSQPRDQLSAEETDHDDGTEEIQLDVNGEVPSLRDTLKI